VGRSVAFEILGGIFQLYIVALQEGVKLHPSFVAEQAAELCARKPAATISIGRQDFQ
jgi:hypothetical protein